MLSPDPFFLISLPSCFTSQLEHNDVILSMWHFGDLSLCHQIDRAMNIVIMRTKDAKIFMPPTPLPSYPTNLKRYISAARLRTPTWSPGVMDVDFALTATPEDTVTEMGVVVVGMDAPFNSIGSDQTGWFTTQSCVDDTSALPRSGAARRYNSGRGRVSRCRQR